MKISFGSFCQLATLMQYKIWGCWAMFYPGQKCDVVTSVLLLYITAEECENGGPSLVSLFVSFSTIFI